MTLQPKQFTLFNRYSPASDASDHALSKYHLARENPTGYAADVHGSLSVVHHGTGPHSIQGWNEPRYGRDLNTGPGQQMLFQERYHSDTPGKSTVDGMFFTREARSMAMPVLAVAQREAVEEYGRSLTPSTDRSAHSEKLVQNLAGQGLIEGNERTSTNGMSFVSPTVQSQRDVGTPEEPSVLAQGKKDVRDLLRSRPGRKRRTDGVQEPLF